MSESLDVQPFRVDIPQADLDDLHERLARTRFPEQIPDAGWDYGTELGYARELVAYWRDTYDWRAAEARLNDFDHFTTTVDGAKIHFIHQRSP
jgi:epoxide hydrolase